MLVRGSRPSVEPMKAAIAGVWPRVGKEIAAHCAALFIDIRGSSVMSAERGLDSTTIALRTKSFLSIAQKLLGKGGATEPTVVKSLGDGLLCVWDLGDDLSHRKYATAKKVLLKAILHLEERIARRLASAWKRKLSEIEIGMGLAAGDATKATVGATLDYFGYTLNLAAKLQGFARPRGLVVDNKYLEDDGDWAKRFNLETREFKVPMIGERLKYYVTPRVYRHHDWTCLSWPGLAIDSSAPSRPRGLNTKGITVLTHEGIQGKIGTLQIWPRNDPRDERGDPFELIIDDFDGLSIMKAERALSLVDRSEHSSRLLQSLVCDPLRTAAEEEDFLFVPVRCGLNALAWHNRHDLSSINRYSDVLGRIGAEFKVGLYDNSGAALPILLSCLPESRLKHFNDVFEAGAEDFKALLALLRKHQKRVQNERRNAKLFLLYHQIASLARELQAGNRIQAVLGGGAWLANPKRMHAATVSSGIPKQSFGFLWMEGCALLTAAHAQAEYILDFIQQEILPAGYQTSLIGAQPYGSVPTASIALRDILAAGRTHGLIKTNIRNKIGTRKVSLRNALLDRYPDALPSIKEATVLFDSVDERSSRIVIRRKPKHLPDWREAWEEIRDEFCQVVP